MLTKKLIQAAGALIFSLLTACATVGGGDARDPLESWNRGVQDFNDGLDKYAIKPVAQGYQWITPDFVDEGVSNFFSNIDDISVTINDLLQFKLEQTGSDGARLIVNSVAGIGGLIDVASLIDLPKHREDFDQTLGVWGVPTGPYLVLPLFGPSSPRGVCGLVGKAAMNPISYIDSAAITGGLFTLNTIDVRSDNLTTEKIIDEASTDRYEFLKNAYFQNRNYLVNDGNVPESEDFDLDEESQGPVNPFSK